MNQQPKPPAALIEIARILLEFEIEQRKKQREAAARAEYLRTQKAELEQVSEAHPESADNQAMQPKQGDSSTPPADSQTQRVQDGQPSQQSG
jgi:hypothetical protein